MKRIMPATAVFTDESRFYDPLTRMGFRHGRVHHAVEVYVSGDAHTNTIEGFWSLVKRGISGVYHNVSAKHLQSYLDEYSWRYNHREIRAVTSIFCFRGSLRRRICVRGLLEIAHEVLAFRYGDFITFCSFLFRFF